MKIIVNGIPEELEKPFSIADYLKYKEIETILVVIELNFKTYPKEEWNQLKLEDGDNLEIIKIVGGG